MAIESATSNEAADWAIIGGGIHGVHLAVRLLCTGVPRERLRIVDPGRGLLASWTRCTSNTGMRFLRSPPVHNLDVDPYALLRFAGSRTSTKGLFTQPYKRPSLELFSDHCRHVVAQYDLDAVHLRASATDIGLARDHVSVHLCTGAELSARRVLLAMGNVNRPRWPAWAAALRERGARVHHVFEPGFVLEPDTYPETVAIVGGGITAAQVALRLADGRRNVVLVARHPIRQRQFDSDPGWIGPKNMWRFSATRDVEARRQMITTARHTGSMPRDVHRALRRALTQRTIRWCRGEMKASLDGDAMTARVGGDTFRVDAVVLATGFAPGRPGGALVDRLVERHALPTAPCGFPIVDEQLRWHPNVFVTGPLAELEIGPVARNIIGARRAAERIGPVAAHCTATGP